MSSSVTAVGNLCADPEIRYTTAGTSVLAMTLAVERRYRKGGEWEGETHFVRGVAFGMLAENLAETVTKGQRLIWHGRLQVRGWETDEGEKRTTTEIVVNDCGPSLRWATAEVYKNVKAPGPPPGRSREEPF